MTDHSDAFLAGRTALVTGGSRNLGPVIARRLAAAGATVAIQYRSEREAAEAVVAGLPPARSGAHCALAADLADEQQAERLYADALEALGGHVDVFVHGAGPMLSLTRLTDAPPSEWNTVFDANVKAAYLGARALAPAMRDRGWGRIVLLSAGSAYVRNHATYGLAKAAIIPLVEELAVDLAPAVTVNAVAPGQIAESAADIAEFDPTFVERTVAATPAGRLVTREDVAGVVAALCSPAFALVTGTTIPLDGGCRLPRF